MIARTMADAREEQPATPKVVRRRDGMPRVTHAGLPRAYFHDVYAWALRTSWGVLLLLFAVAYGLVNVFFAALYLAAGDTIAGARPGSFADAFSFSVQTLSTIGYGQLTPVGFGHAIVAIESAAGVIVVALATGLVFSKFSRPTARVMFSRRIVIHERNGQRTLSFRIANARGNEVIEAAVRCTALKNELSDEGERMRVLHDMNLRRDTNPVFSLSWVVMHTIDESSPPESSSRTLRSTSAHALTTDRAVDRSASAASRGSPNRFPEATKSHGDQWT